MNVLMIDIGGTNVKLMVSGVDEVRKFKSGGKLTARMLIDETQKRTRDWDFDVISIGFPGPVAHCQPAREPFNLGIGWQGFDFEAAFDRPVRIINDAALQALGSYEGGRMLFLGFGTSIGSTLIVDDAIIPLELGLLRLSKSERFVDALSDAGRKRLGRKRWQKAVFEAVATLQDAFCPGDTVLGGGNAKLLDALPEGCRGGSNRDAFAGAVRMWAGSGMIAEPRHTSWQIRRPVTKTEMK